MIRIALLGATAAVLLSAGTAAAQTAGAAPAAQPAQSQPLGGPVVPGVCLLSREAIFANAVVGKAASARLNELTQAAQSEVDAQRKPLEADTRALESQPDNAQTRQRREQVTRRWQALRELAAQHSREIEATRVKAMNRIAGEAQPVIAQVYTQKKCGLLLDRGSALGGNFANDLTADAVKGLDAKITTISFNRETLPAAAPASAQ